MFLLLTFCWWAVAFHAQARLFCMALRDRKDGDKTKHARQVLGIHQKTAIPIIHMTCVYWYIYRTVHIYIYYIHIFIVFHTYVYIYICIHSFFWLINIGNPKILDLWLEMFSSMALFAKLLCGLNFGAGPGSNIQPTSTNYNCFFQNQVLGCLLYTINLGNHHGQHKNFQYYGILRSHISCLDHGTHVQFVLFNLLISMCRKKNNNHFWYNKQNIWYD